MTNNDILRRVRYIFDLSDYLMMDIFALADATVNRAEISDWLKKDDDPEFIPILDKDLALFLNGFIYLKRGKKEGPVAPSEKKLNNNQIFRKLRIALQLKDEDIIRLLKLAGMDFSKSELSALFRNPTQSQYRACKDQVLRKFLQGLQISYSK